MTEDPKKDEEKPKKDNEDDDNSMQLFPVRSSKALIKAFDARHPTNRAEAIRDLMEKDLEAAGDSVPLSVNYERFSSDAEGCRREMDRIKKAMGSKFQVVQSVALRTLPLTVENLPLIRRGILLDDSFERNDIEDYVKYLEIWLKNEDIVEKIAEYRFKVFGIPKPKIKIVESKKAKKRYIPPEQLCGCGVHETKSEHNPRCHNKIDSMSHGINPNLTVQDHLVAMRNVGAEHTTSAEEKEMIVAFLKDQGTPKQKLLVNSYFVSHNFPEPFPDIKPKEDDEAEEPED